MRHFVRGFFLGLIVGGLLGWLGRIARSTEWETLSVPLRRVEEKPPEDFTALRGIGPAFAQRLHQAGIHTYAQLARMTPAELAEHCGVPVSRIHRDDWVGQAAAQIQ